MSEQIPANVERRRFWLLLSLFSGLSIFFGSDIWFLRPKSTIYISHLTAIFLPVMMLAILVRWNRITLKGCFLTNPFQQFGFFGFFYVTLLIWFSIEAVYFLFYAGTKLLYYLFVGEAYISSYSAGRIAPSIRFLICTYSPFTEELLFRGAFIACTGFALQTRMQKLRLASVSSALFGVFHILSGIPAVIASFAFGLAMCFILVRVRNLWPLILAHAFVNFLRAF